jgi:hypothetical protein
MKTPVFDPKDKINQLPEVKEDLFDSLEHPTNGPGYCREELASAKIQPLQSYETKYHQGHEHTHGVIGEDWTFQNSHLEPLPHGGLKQGPQGKESGEFLFAWVERREVNVLRSRSPWGTSSKER